MLIAPAKKDNNNATPHYMYNLRESPSPSLHRPHFIGGGGTSKVFHSMEMQHDDDAIIH